MTTKQAKKILKKEAANTYASIYDTMYQKIARMAFIDGMIFWDMVKAGAVTEDMINKDFFDTLNESNK
jgi:hypothetical protein